MPEIQSLVEQNIVEVPLYTHLDAARYLRAPVFVILSSSAVPPYHPIEMFERFWHDPLFHSRFVDENGPFSAKDKASRISFRSLASMFVTTAILGSQVNELPFLKWHPKEVIHFLEVTRETNRRIIDDSRLFSDPSWVLSQYDRIFYPGSDSVRKNLLKLIALYQARVELRDGIPIHLFPFSRDPTSDAPRAVVIDPEIRFGRPTLKGAPTDVLAERWRAGDGSAELAEDYGLTTDEVEEALRYEAIPPHPFSIFPFPPFGW
ncbi:DUF433 domain-containing protein [Fimbriiglobus ruber]|uniref:DUF433 domain-containing protein n=1 Tax=Fimbriiglobus ruber TaxID=1908690 RepID=UPI001179F4CE|nr:DUF433 domain-containing protein [Fimbriiglobus ruber]